MHAGRGVSLDVGHDVRVPHVSVLVGHAPRELVLVDDLTCQQPAQGQVDDGGGLSS